MHVERHHTRRLVDAVRPPSSKTALKHLRPKACGWQIWHEADHALGYGLRQWQQCQMQAWQARST